MIMDYDYYYGLAKEPQFLAGKEWYEKQTLNV
jgi:hypothetical protein